MNYFPKSPIPDWPKRSLRGGKPIKEFVASRAIDRDGANWNAVKALVRAELYNDGAPLICIQCGKPADSKGYATCGH